MKKAIVFNHDDTWETVSQRLFEILTVNGLLHVDRKNINDTLVTKEGALILEFIENL